MRRRIFIALGANQPSPAGFPCQTLGRVLTNIVRAGAVLEASSRLYGSEPIGNNEENNLRHGFVNSVIRASITCAPALFLKRLQKIERLYGRKKKPTRLVRDRPLDLDILLCALYQGEADESCRVPHPRMAERAFVLVPLDELSGRKPPRLLGARARARGRVFLLRSRKK